MSSPWGFAVETSIHALRMCGSGMFDQFPNLKIIVGHLGEHIPYDLWRIDARMRFSPRGYEGKHPLGDYFRKHFYVTTSGNFCDPSFHVRFGSHGCRSDVIQRRLSVRENG